MSVLIYIEKITPRLSYICDLIFEQYFGLKYEFTFDKDKYFQCNLPRLNYSSASLLVDDFYIPAMGLLMESDISEKEITVSDYQEVPMFFQSSNQGAVLPFDVFSAIFYLVSRYEEYLPFEPDGHGRFTAKSSLAYRAGFLHLPVVDIWIGLLKQKLKTTYPHLVFRQRQYRFQPTYDVDMAWSFLEKGFLRTIGATVKDVLRLDLKRVIERSKVKMGITKDPFDVFGFLEKLAVKYQLAPHYFFLVGEYGKFDKNISPNNPKLQDLIRKIRQKGYSIGIHPSYAGGGQKDTLEKEKADLERIIGKPVLTSRHHFLKIRFPKTFRLLLKAGIEEDYSLGYADAIGFRAGIARPFYWYDLETEKTTSLKLLPFQVMDVTLKVYLKLLPSQAIEQVKKVAEEVRKVDGVLITLWHNSSFSDADGWGGWRTAYEEILKKIH